MSTLSHAMRMRFAEVKKRSHEDTALRRAFEVSENIALFIATPFVGLLYVLTFTLVGAAAVLCYGLKAFGVRCRIFHR
jgi:hypothetical protein